MRRQPVNNSNLLLITVVFILYLTLISYTDFNGRLCSYKTFNKIKSPLIVAKPIIESQNANEILVNIPGAKAIWIFRDFNDVIASFVKKWGSRKINNWNLLPIVESDLKNWRGESVSKETRKLILKYYSKNLNEYDSAALFWYARNIIFIEKEMYKNENIMLVKYEDFVLEPYEEIREVYEFIGIKDFNKKIISLV